MLPGSTSRSQTVQATDQNDATSQNDKITRKQFYEQQQ